VEKNDLINIIQARLSSECEAIKAQWAHPEGTTTRHFVVEELLPAEVCRNIYEAFPRDGGGFFSRSSFREKKRTSANLDAYSPILGAITYALQDSRVVRQIADLVGMRELEPDPKLYAGGLSMMFKEDFLNPHIDNSHDADRMKYRRLNLLYYVSPNWQLENGGNLELWNSDQTVPKAIVAKPNRLVVMETNKTTWHSVSPVVVDTPRCCVSNYYFSEESPESAEYFHVTSFTGRPDEKLKRAAALVDNGIRNVVSKTFKVGRGKSLVNKSSGDKN
jgi:Rps23 Pro-64 3,4-dihydroxylase Tpa1-like proline 4-hydroxylase